MPCRKHPILFANNVEMYKGILEKAKHVSVPYGDAIVLQSPPPINTHK